MEPEEPLSRLKVGLMLDSLTVPAWVARIVRQMLAAEFVDVSLVLLNGEVRRDEPQVSRLRAPRRHYLLFNLYERLDSRVFAPEPNAFAGVNIANELASARIVRTVPERPKPFEHRFDASAVSDVRAADLDVLLRFGFNIIRGDILTCARYGVWSYHHGDNREYRGQPAFFWEMYEGNPVTGTMLQVLSDELDAGRIIYRSWSATDPTSLHRGRNAAYWKTADFVIRCLTRLHHEGWESFEKQPDFHERAVYERRLYRKPTNRQMVRFLALLAWGMARRQLDKYAFRDKWYVGIDSEATRSPVEESATAVRRFRRLLAPAGRYYADPFVVAADDGYHLFVEDYDEAAGRGVISHTRVRTSGPLEPIAPVLTRPYHLSYPCVFRAGDQWYMVPESRESRAVELYRADPFPRCWVLDRVLLDDVDAVDATVVEHDERWWLFVNIAVPGASVIDELHVFYADTLTDGWTPHAANPVVSDVRRARPAGRLFMHDGALIRPGQDCSERYGGATVFHHVTRLTPQEYAETPIGRLVPRGHGNIGTHTYNAVGRLQVIDGERRRLLPMAWLARRLHRD